MNHHRDSLRPGLRTAHCHSRPLSLSKNQRHATGTNQQHVVKTKKSPPKKTGPRRIALGRRNHLLAQAQLADQLLIVVWVGLRQIAEQTVALTDHHQQTTAAVEILVVPLHVIRQGVDSRREHGNLDFG